jgi:TolB-like protein/tRNA A-37 threonylcarbamoyl transferase component Bud32/Flp pilus assembly protein TadD
MPASSQVPAGLRAALVDRYAIETEVGRGGMATVYLARDVKHARRVALKVMHPELAAALGHERFLREITTTASLHHPHILPLYDSGEVDGFLFYVMPFVEGESLRDRLDRERQLAVDDAIRITLEVADALSYAHGRGVVHRDIKPENILLEGGHAMVADFGIARALDVAGSETLTQTGVAVGTPQYMSPEQATGERALDGRSDLYSLACVLFEMLAGQPPFTGPSGESVVRQHLAVDPPMITSLRPAVPGSVATTLRRALEKVPADRFDDARQLADALSADVGATPEPSEPRASWRLPAGVTALTVVAVVIVAGMLMVRGRSPAAATDSVAVMPFADLGSDRSDAYLGDGIAETLIDALTNQQGLQVAGRTSAFSMRDKDLDAREIGRRLGVATVLEGSIQRSGNRLRITAQLIKTADGLNLWSRSFDRDAGDIFAVQDEVARAVVTALQGTVLPPGDTAFAAQGTHNPAAYDAYLLGRFYWNKRTASDLVEAARYFQQAIAADSTYARAWSGLADSYVLFIPAEYDVAGIRPDSILDLAEQAARRAVTLAPELGEAYSSLGEILEYRKKWVEAREAFERGVTLSPGYPTAHQWYAYDLQVWNRWDEAIRELERAKELDPLSMVIVVSLAQAYDGAGRWDDAAAMYDQAAALAPDHLLVVVYRFWHDLLAGDTARWATSYLQYARVVGSDTVAARALSRQLEDPAQRDAALRTIARNEDFHAPYNRLVVARVLDGDDAVVDCVSSLVDSPDRDRVNSGALYALLSPELRADPRMQEALTRLGYPARTRR